MTSIPLVNKWPLGLLPFSNDFEWPKEEEEEGKKTGLKRENDHRARYARRKSFLS